MTKSLVDDNLGVGHCCTDAEAAASLAQGHPKAKAAPVGFGMKNRTADGDGPDDDARDPSFEKGEKL